MLFEELQPNGTTKKKKFKDLSRPAQYGIVLGSGLMAFLLYRGVKSLVGSNVKRVPVNPDLLKYETTTGETRIWNPDPLAKEIYENLEGYNLSVYPETTDKILRLSDEQLKALYNHYNQYYAKDEPTLTQLIDGEWYVAVGRDSYQLAVSRLKSLGLN